MAIATDIRAWTPGDPDCIAPADEILDPILSAEFVDRIAHDEEAQGADLLACLGSPWYWLANHCVTLDEHDAANPYKRFPPLPYAQAVADLWWWCGVRYPILALPKSRKVLATWELSGLFFGECEFVPAKRNAVQSHDLDEAMAIIAKMHGVWLRQPPWIQQPCTWTTTEARFGNDSVFVALPGGARQLQGPTLSGLLYDEVGDHEEAQETYEAAQAAVAGGGRIVMTGRTPRSWWHDEFLADHLGGEQ
jgi:hypothetical protein